MRKIFMTTTMPSQPLKRKFKDTLTDLISAFQQAPVNPLQHFLRTTIAGDILLQDVAYDLDSAIGTLETKYDTTQKELFAVISQNQKLEQTLQDSNISYQKTADKPIVIRYKVNDIITKYDLSASNQKSKATEVTKLQQEVRQLEISYEDVAQDLEAQKTQQTYLRLKVALHGLPDPFAKNEVDEYKDAVASLLETDKKQQDAKYEKTRHNIACNRIIGELYTQDYTLSGNYHQETLQKIHTPENIHAYFHNSTEVEQTVNALVDPTQKKDYAAQKENRIKLTELVKQHTEYQSAVFNVAKGIAVKENALAEEVGIALANATNQAQYWQFVGDLIGASKTANRPDRLQWQEICYTKAKQ